MARGQNSSARFIEHLGGLPPGAALGGMHSARASGFEPELNASSEFLSSMDRVAQENASRRIRSADSGYGLAGPPSGMRGRSNAPIKTNVGSPAPVQKQPQAFDAVLKERTMSMSSEEMKFLRKVKTAPASDSRRNKDNRNQNGDSPELPLGESLLIGTSLSPK